MKLSCLSLLLAVSGALSTQAAIVTKDIAYKQGSVTLKGVLVYDDSKTAHGPLPGVLVIPEWWGLNDYAKKRAEQIAAMGYVAFAVDMYGDGKTTEDAKQAGQWASAFYGGSLFAERAQAGLEQLIGSGLVDKSKVAAIGFCFGGAACQSLAYSGAPLAGIVSFHGSPIPAPPSVAGKVHAKFLLLNGGADPFLGAEAKATWLKSLQDAKIDFQSVDYPGAVHAFTNPDADRLATANGLTGKIGYNGKAASESWEKMQTFLKALFGR